MDITAFGLEIGKYLLFVSVFSFPFTFMSTDMFLLSLLDMVKAMHNNSSMYMNHSLGTQTRQSLYSCMNKTIGRSFDHDLNLQEDAREFCFRDLMACSYSISAFQVLIVDNEKLKLVLFSFSRKIDLKKLHTRMRV